MTDKYVILGKNQCPVNGRCGITEDGILDADKLIVEGFNLCFLVRDTGSQLREPLRSCLHKLLDRTLEALPGHLASLLDRLLVFSLKLG